ncbi:MAG: hypothetical protein JNM62_09550 [Flavobacteriales bacterium]|nr:hypothetical protein [Flavobacteriales bacterium]
MNVRALIRSLCIAAKITFVTDTMSQSEAGLGLAIAQSAPWRAFMSDDRGEVSVNLQPAFGVFASYNNQIEAGRMAWMRAEFGYAQYRLTLVQNGYSSCCSTRDSATIKARTLALRLGPEFEIGRNTRLFLPIQFAWPLSSTSSGVRTKTPDYTRRPYSDEKGEYGAFDVSLGAAIYFRIPIGTTYGLSLGPSLTVGLFDQVKTMADMRLWNYGALVALQRRVVSKALTPD